MMELSFLFPLAETGVSPRSLELRSLEEAGPVLLAYGLLMFVGLVVLGFVAVRVARERATWSRRVARLQWRPWSWADATQVVRVILVAFAIAILAQWALHALFTERVDREPALLIVVESILVHLPVLLYVYIFMARRGYRWKAAFGARGRSPLHDIGLGALLYVALLPVVAAGSWLYTLGLHALGFEPTPQDLLFLFSAEASPAVRFYMILLAILVAPVFEELVFRGIGLPVFAQRWGVFRGVVFLSLCFAAIHLHIPSLVALFGLAVALALAYIWTGSLLVPTVMHALFNAVNLGLLTYLGYN